MRAEGVRRGKREMERKMRLLKELLSVLERLERLEREYASLGEVVFEDLKRELGSWFVEYPLFQGS